MVAKPLSAHSRYELLPGLILAFHGTDESIAEAVLSGKQHLKSSRNSYDWLGHGIYFWEYSPQRAREFAEEAAKHPRRSSGIIRNPAVVGAVIDPGTCLNLLEASALDKLKQAYQIIQLLEDPLTAK